MSDPFIGEINLFAGNFAPRGWAFCRAKSCPSPRTRRFFPCWAPIMEAMAGRLSGLPDLRGRVIVGTASDPEWTSGSWAESRASL